MMRLDKFIAASGRYSRSESRDVIKKGRVLVNGTVITDASAKVDETKDNISAEGYCLTAPGERYFLLHKPAGILTATRDNSQKTVIDLFSDEERKLGLTPAGRLDKDTTGLLIVTTDGDYVHKLISPRKHVAKVYRAEVDGALNEADITAFRSGIILEDGTECMPALLQFTDPCVGYATVMEGKYHQVKRMFASRGKHVIHLHRCSIGKLALPEDLLPGQYREISAEEAQQAIISEDFLN